VCRSARRRMDYCVVIGLCGRTTFDGCSRFSSALVTMLCFRVNPFLMQYGCQNGTKLI
jgi:hypothetical protein